MELGQQCNESNREYISSPGYDTSSSNPLMSSPDPGEYTYEAAIQNYKTRVSLATQNGRQVNSFLKDSHPEEYQSEHLERNVQKIEQNYDSEIETNQNMNTNDTISNEKYFPSLDISKRREIFENPVVSLPETKNTIKDFQIKSIKERLSTLELTTKTKEEQEEKKLEQITFEIPTLKERFVILEKRAEPTKPKIELPLSLPLKERLSNLKSLIDFSDTDLCNQNKQNFSSNNQNIVKDSSDEETSNNNSIIKRSEQSYNCSKESIEIEESVQKTSNDIHKNINKAVDTGLTETMKNTTTHLPVPDLISNIDKAEPNHKDKISEEIDQDASVSQLFSVNETTAICDDTLLIDVQQLTENLGSDKVEGYNYNFDETTLNTSMFDETTATEDASLPSLASPFHQSFAEVFEDTYVNKLLSPMLNMSITSTKEEEASLSFIKTTYLVFI